MHLSPNLSHIALKRSWRHSQARNSIWALFKTLVESPLKLDLNTQNSLFAFKQSRFGVNSALFAELGWDLIFKLDRRLGENLFLGPAHENDLALLELNSVLFWTESNELWQKWIENVHVTKIFRHIKLSSTQVVWQEFFSSFCCSFKNFRLIFQTIF